MNDEPQIVWLSGTEEIRLISHLLDPNNLPDMRERQTGRTKKLALVYAMLSLKTPFHRIIIEDHWDDLSAHSNLHRQVLKVLDALNIDYITGKCDVADRDEGSFTGVKHKGTRFFVIAQPIIRS